MEDRPRAKVERRYRADAQILLLGMTLLRRQGVGDGTVSWSEFNEGGNTARLLEFGAYSAPEHAAGLNRLGFIREMCWLKEAGTPESIYFGLMTSSPEESTEEAKRALHSNAKELQYSAIDGRVGAGQAQVRVAQFVAAAGEHRPRLVELAHEALKQESGAQQTGTSAGAGTFLNTLANLLARGGAAEGYYSYSNRLYRMQVRPAADPKATEGFRQRGLLGPAASAIRVSGRIWRETDGRESEFRLWIPKPAERPLPLRIEYQPKNYLRLAFEAEGA
jgi:hypothetical protein